MPQSARLTFGNTHWNDCWVYIVYGKVQKGIYFISRIMDWWDWHLFYLLDLCFMTAMLIWIMIPENLSSPSHWLGLARPAHMMDPSPSNCQNISENFLINIWSYFPTRWWSSDLSMVHVSMYPSQVFSSLHLCDCTQPLGRMAPISWSRHNIF